MDDPQVVSRDEWLTARRQLLAKEKEFSRQRDALACERRKLPMVEVDRKHPGAGIEQLRASREALPGGAYLSGSLRRAAHSG